MASHACRHHRAGRRFRHRRDPRRCRTHIAARDMIDVGRRDPLRWTLGARAMPRRHAGDADNTARFCRVKPRSSHGPGGGQSLAAGSASCPRLSAVWLCPGWVDRSVENGEEMLADGRQSVRRQAERPRRSVDQSGARLAEMPGDNPQPMAGETRPRAGETHQRRAETQPGSGTAGETRQRATEAQPGSG